MIEVKRMKGNWIADFRSSVRRDEVMDLFGTLELPTTFTSSIPYSIVKAEIQKLNPEEEVV